MVCTWDMVWGMRVLVAGVAGRVRCEPSVIKTNLRVTSAGRTP